MLARTLATLVLLACAAPAWGQSFERFGVRDGLSAESIADLSFDARGVLWIATDDGLSRYDGHGFRTYRYQSGADGTLPSSRLSAVHASSAGEVWVGTVQGLVRLNPRTGWFRRVAGFPRGASIGVITEGDDGVIWIGTSRRGLWRYDPRQRRATRIETAGPAAVRERIIAIVAEGDDVWVQYAKPEGGGRCRVSAQERECSTPPPGSLIDLEGTAVYATEGDRVEWLGSAESWSFAPSLGVLRSGVPTGTGEIWLGSLEGILVVRQDETWTQIKPDPEARRGLGGYDIRALVRDRQGSVWVGTEAGLYVARTPVGPFETFRHIQTDPETLSDDRVNGMAERDGSLWITTNGGLNRLDLASGRVERIDATIRRAEIGTFPNAFWQILAPASGEILVGAKRNGLLRLDGDALRPVTPADEIPALMPVRGLFLDASGALWLTSELGVWRRSPEGTTRRVALTPQTPSNTTFQSQDGTIWVLADGGLLRYDDATDRLSLVPIDCRSGAQVRDIWSAVETPRDPGPLWLASAGTGLVRFDPASGDVECIGLAAGLPTEAVMSVLTDARGFLWAGTSSGLVRLDPVSRDVATFTSSDGLQGDVFNLMAALRLSDGRLAFGGPSGLTLVSPEAVRQPPAPDVVLSGFERAGRLARGLPFPGDTLRLNHDEAAFGIRFAAVDFRAPRKHRYRYRLVGLDGQWQRTDGTAPRAAYSGLAPGLYRFQVAGAAADTPFGTPTEVWVEVVPALWQTPAFRFSVFFIGLALVVGAVFTIGLRRTAIAEQAAAEAAEVRRRLSDARERERVRLARDLHDGPVQNLYRVGHDLDRLGESVGASGVLPVRERVGDVARSLRQMLVELRPTLAEHLGLGPALKTVARHAEERYTDLAITVEDEASGVEIDAASRVALFRIAQEAIENVGRHSAASRSRITLDAHDGGLRLTVRDNGRGFAVPERMVDLARQEHFGLVGAKERAEAVGGRFHVRSSPGRGTAVEAWVPSAPPPEAE